MLPLTEEDWHQHQGQCVSFPHGFMISWWPGLGHEAHELQSMTACLCTTEVCQEFCTRVFQNRQFIQQLLFNSRGVTHLCHCPILGQHTPHIAAPHVFREEHLHHHNQQ
jgi:hypothetical protein